ncbi:SGNH hydrolase-type esterase domain-containing protein [Triangularia verruculosa]|uniref:SGNH hydrolase-type esterase domain-containing protein n=1 Tax=Triangularia verruculosa TaxID=2587418 RepID=A0AAN6XC68_9PEZI|nr:SGNH hydrolase-type esterase domain-containing protein [Triangularia verruculosa]
MAARQKLRILCFGDSLTAGYSDLGCIYHPYHAKMGQMLAMAFPDHDITIVERGDIGDTVKTGFLTRMQECLPPSKNKSDKPPYDWVIVLGGTNDIAFAVPPQDIFKKLTEVWDVPLRRGCKVLALTVPDVMSPEGKLKTRGDADRKVLNDLIIEYHKPNLHVYDLHDALSLTKMSPTDRKKYRNDHVHFTPTGYDLIGNKVGMALVGLLVKQRVADLPPAKRRRIFKNDDKLFEEETGSPDSLEGGYVVVRRTDLD